MPTQSYSLLSPKSVLLTKNLKSIPAEYILSNDFLEDLAMNSREKIAHFTNSFCLGAVHLCRGPHHAFVLPASIPPWCWNLHWRLPVNAIHFSVGYITLISAFINFIYCFTKSNLCVIIDSTTNFKMFHKEYCLSKLYISLIYITVYI